MNLIERRRGMVNTAESLPNYVSDGLVLWLDGVIKDNTAARTWTDLVSGYVFSISSSYPNDYKINNSDNVQFNGQPLYDSSFNTPKAITSTIEFVVDCPSLTSTSNSITIFKPKNITGLQIAAATYNGYFIFVQGGVLGAGNIMNRKYRPTLTKASFSINNSRPYQNGVSMSYNGSDYWSNINYNIVGGSSNLKIYCIRIYNRVLARDEQLHNLAIDNERFNLGLTL